MAGDLIEVVAVHVHLVGRVRFQGDVGDAAERSGVAAHETARHLGEVAGVQLLQRPDGIRAARTVGRRRG